MRGLERVSALLPFIAVFLLAGAFYSIKEYMESLKSLIRRLSSFLEEATEKKGRLSSRIEVSDGRISRLRNRELMLAGLYEITKRTSGDLTFNEIFGALAIFLRENFIFRKSELLILKEHDGIMKVEKAYKVYKEEDQADEASETDYAGVLGLFPEEKKEAYISNDGIEGFAAVPLLSENKFVGVLTADGIRREDLDRFVIVATQFALEIKKVLLYETVEELAITDSLTGLYTRRYFFERLNEELNRSKRHSLKFAFVMFDIDNFKLCNDTHGHLVGDVILREVAAIIKANIRQIDLAARYGGEEFSVILPETDKKGAMLVADRIKKRVEESVFRAYDEKLNITMSGGISAYPEDSESAADLVEKADRALYKAKSSGKNIVCEYKD